MNDGAITFSARILRKQPNLPRYVVVKPDYVKGHTRSFRAMVRLNGSPALERNIRPWGRGSDVFFFNLTDPQCRKAGLDTGDLCTVNIHPIDPPE